MRTKLTERSECKFCPNDAASKEFLRDPGVTL